MCSSYTRTGVKSNMAVAEVETLSGYKFDEDFNSQLTTIQDLQRVELENDDTKMNIYFNPVWFNYLYQNMYIDDRRFKLANQGW